MFASPSLARQYLRSYCTKVYANLTMQERQLLQIQCAGTPTVIRCTPDREIRWHHVRGSLRAPLNITPRYGIEGFKGRPHLCPHYAERCKHLGRRLRDSCGDSVSLAYHWRVSLAYHHIWRKWLGHSVVRLA